MIEQNNAEILQIIFSDIDLTIKLRLKYRETNLSVLAFHVNDYSDVKELLQKFLKETDLSKKMEFLADAMNIGSLDKPLSELVFLLNILWKYDWRELKLNTDSCNSGEGANKDE